MLRIFLSLIAILFCFSFGSEQTKQKKIILPPGSNPSGNWSPGILVNGTLYVAGMGGEDAAGKIPANFDAEVKQSLENIGVVLKEAGMVPADVVSAQVYLTDKSLFERMNAVYTSYFKVPRPARTTVVVAKLVGDVHIEITVTARK